MVDGPDGIEAGAYRGLRLVDTTTSTPKTTNEIAERLSRSGITVLGAPVSGGLRCRGRDADDVVGGDEAAFDGFSPLSGYASDSYHVGDRPGDDQAVKLLNDYLSFLGLLGASEAVALGQRLDLDASTMIEIFNRSSGRNATTEEKIPDQIIPGHYDLGVSLELMHKDIRLFGRLADENDVPVVLGDTVRSLAGDAKKAPGEADVTRTYEFVASRTDPAEDE